jgi:hypothetical protein
LPFLTDRARLAAVLATTALLVAGCGAASPHATPIRTAPLQSIFEAQGQLLAAPGPTLDLLRRLGVDEIRVFLPWSSLAPSAQSSTRPAGFDPSSPAAYAPAAWAPYDAIVRAAAARGVGVDMTLEGGAPQWAEAPGQPPGPAGVWKPSASDYGAFVHAVAARYDGTYRPSGSSTPLPRVSSWSIWNEPNYGEQLAPQAIAHSTIEVSPMLYRQLVGAAWSALTSTGHAADTILIGELAPRGITTGDNPGNYSGMVPLRFVRALYCVDGSFNELRGTAAAARGCPTKAAASASFVRDNPGLFDATGVAVHPYPQGGVPPNVPTPGEPDYADLPVLGRLERALDRAQQAYGQDRHMLIYSTEFGYQTDPPETIARAIDPRLAAFYLNWGEFISWSDPRIASFDQYLLTDPPAGNFATGLEFANGTPKALYYAFRLPIFLPSTTATRGKALELWGCVRPARYARFDTNHMQTAQVQFRSNGSSGFRTLKQVVISDPYGYLDTQVTFPGRGSVRLAWTYPHGPTIYSRTVTVTMK